MKIPLICHPDTPCSALHGVSVHVEPRGLVYEMLGNFEDVSFPPMAEPMRVNGLWQTTCFEAFIADGEGYREYNFSPSGAWAAYRFSGYREGMADLEMEAPRVSHDGAVVRVDWDENLMGRAFALTAVIEEKSGAKSYWSLAHPQGKPDFHHRDCFVGNLTASGLA